MKTGKNANMSNFLPGEAGKDLKPVELNAADPHLLGGSLPLKPLGSTDAPDVLRAAQCPIVWQDLPVHTPETLADMKVIIEEALQRAATAGEVAFLILSDLNGEVLCSARFLDLGAEDRSLEIGWTWISRTAERSLIDSAQFYIPLKYGFETLGCAQMQIKIDGDSDRTFRALEGFGVDFEGGLRKERIMYEGGIKGAEMISIPSKEWPALKGSFQELSASQMRLELRAQLERIWIYPIKSLDGAVVYESAVTQGSGLRWDRSWQIVDAQTREVLSAKRLAELQRVSADFEVLSSGLLVTLSARDIEKGEVNQGVRALIPGEEVIVASWLSRFLDREVDLEFSDQGFPDDTEARGPTIISGETILELAKRFSLSPDEIRRRFRTNIELSGDNLPPFWEDSLFGRPGTLVHFQIGPVEFVGTNPCQRCAVPARDSLTGSVDSGFQGRFARLRRQLLPPWACEERFNHYYRLAVNTKVDQDQVGKAIVVGDLLRCGDAD
jgi:uncharacterized protein YcbX